jgi:hypothetical protein
MEKMGEIKMGQDARKQFSMNDPAASSGVSQ